MNTRYAIVMAVLAFGFGQARPENLVINGSFEFPAQSTNTIASLPAGGTNLFGWTIEGTGTDYLVTTPLNGWSFGALSGKQFFDFNHPTAALSQSIQTRAGESYEVTFSVGYFQGLTNMQVTAEAISTNGSLLGSLTAGTPATAGWNPPSRFRFVATGNTVMLRFRGSNATPNVDLTLDAVSVERLTPRLSIQTSPLRICWDSQTNRMYQIQYRSDLLSNAWTDLGSPIPGTGTTDCLTQPTIESSRFYRIVLLP